MNAKIEFLAHVEDVNEKIICAKITRYKKVCILKPNFSEEDFNSFVESLDFIYDDGYGSQELFGIILFEDSWSDRYEYDGSELWSNNKRPKIEEVMNY